VDEKTAVQEYCRRFGPALEEWFKPGDLADTPPALTGQLLAKISQHMPVLEQLERWHAQPAGSERGEEHAVLAKRFVDLPLARDVQWIARQVHVRR
jgi:hypothetical protein